jgi:hypothetical protein
MSPLLEHSESEVKMIVERDGLVKRLHGKFILRKSATNTQTLEPIFAYYEMSYSVRIPKVKEFKYCFLKWVKHNARIGKLKYVGKMAYLVNFEGVHQPISSLNHDFIKISKAQKRISTETALKMLKSGQVFPYVQGVHGGLLANTYRS